MSEKFEIKYPVSAKGTVSYLGVRDYKERDLTLSVRRNSSIAGYWQTRFEAIADALNRIPQLEAEAAEWKLSANLSAESLARNVERMESLRMRNVELEADVERLRKRCAVMEAERLASQPVTTLETSNLPEPITSRDLFAAAALAGLIAYRGPCNPGHTDDRTIFAFAMADAMLAEAKKGGA